jgi:hypothetical protein
VSKITAGIELMAVTFRRRNQFKFLQAGNKIVFLSGQIAISAQSSESRNFVVFLPIAGPPSVDPQVPVEMLLAGCVGRPTGRPRRCRNHPILLSGKPIGTFIPPSAMTRAPSGMTLVARPQAGAERPSLIGRFCNSGFCSGPPRHVKRCYAATPLLAYGLRGMIPTFEDFAVVDYAARPRTHEHGLP